MWNTEKNKFKVKKKLDWKMFIKRKVKMAPYSLQQGLFIRLKNRNNVFPDWEKCVQRKHEKITIFIYRTFQNPFWHVKNVSNNKNSQVLQFFFLSLRLLVLPLVNKIKSVQNYFGYKLVLKTICIIAPKM